MTRSPLAGSTILVTRPAGRSERLVNLLDRKGARVIAAPTISLRPVRSAALTAALRDLAAGEFAWLILTSPATVGMLDDRLDGPRDVRASVAAIGDGTAAAFRRWARRALRDGSVDAITFTSASTVKGFIAAGGAVERPVRIVCIGPVTAKETRAQGLRVHAVADPHTTDGLVAALERAFRNRPRR